MNEIEMLSSLGEVVQPPDQATVDRLRARLLAHIDQRASAKQSRRWALRWPTAMLRAAFSVVLELLLSGAAQTRALGRRWRKWTRSRSHSTTVVIAALVISGSAAAAVVTLNASRSQPLAGRVPGAIEPASWAGYRYTITVTPNLSAGEAFWNTFITYTRNNRTGSGSGGGGGGSLAPTRSNPLFGGDIDQFDVGAVRGQRGDTVDYILTGPAVAAVRVGSRTIRTFSSPELPAGDRAAVFFVPAGSPVLTLNWRPGEPIRSFTLIRSLTATGRLMKVPTKVPTLAVLPLDDHGNVIPTHTTIPPSPFPHFWQAPSAITPGNESPPYHGPSHPLPGVCELAQHGLAALRPEWGHAIHQLLPAKNSVGELFLSCVDTKYFLHGWPLTVGVLVDARRPGQVLGPIPGARPVAGRPGTVDFEAGNLTARRRGQAWLVVQGGTGVAQRLRVLDALRISKLTVPAS